ncbi:sensor histidine kinase [Facilibium subflavum]|uniref:sensor histidine kinase n=1 Tax=Facilibium subflavum TaxID=2219058 RepID=UPI0013C29E90|nr:HAMP domain-containing sensor histidine kinase [Facilibium subflavum]
MGIYWLTKYLPSEASKQEIVRLTKNIEFLSHHFYSEKEFVNYIHSLQKHRIRVSGYMLKLSLGKKSLCHSHESANVVIALDNEKCFFFRYNNNVGITLLFTKDAPVNITIWLPLLSVLLAIILTLIYIFIIYQSYLHSVFYVNYLHNYSRNMEKAKRIESQYFDKFLSHLNQKIISSTTNIESIIKSRAKLLATTLHDIQGPLNRIRLRMEIEKGEIPDKDEKDFNEIHHICSSLVMYGKNDWLTTEPNRYFDLIPLLEEIITDYRSVGHNIIAHEFSHKSIFIYGKQNALKRAFNNLIDNAFSHASIVSLRLHKLRHKVIVTIIDNGPGIDEEIMPLILNVGLSTKGSSGIGLAIVKEILDFHKADMKMTNTKDGLKIEIELPVL